MVTLQLGTYVLPDDLKLYKFFPGKAYKFHDLIVNERTAFLDVRGLEGLPSDPRKWVDDDILDVISTDRVDRKIAHGGKQPSRLVHSVGDKQTLTFLRGLLLEAKKGDFIVMPDKGYTTDVNVGMLADDPGVLKTISAIDDKIRYEYFGRKIIWLGRIPKRAFSQDIINLLHTQATFFDIGRSHYDEVLRLSLEDYVYDGQYVSTFHTSKKIFTSRDNFLTSVWFELLQILADREKSGKSLGQSGIYDLVITSDLKDEDRDDLSILIQSPGWFRLRSTDPSPLVAIALFGLAISGVPFEKAKTATTHATVVRDASQQCIGQVDESVRDYLNLLGKARWEQACKLAVQAKDEASLKADTKVTKN